MVFKKGHKPWITGKNHTDESKRKMSESKKGHKHKGGYKWGHHTEEAKRKISESNKGKHTWNKGLKGGIPWNKGLTKETDNRIKPGWLKGRHLPEELKQNLSKINKEKWKDKAYALNIKTKVRGYHHTDEARKKISMAGMDRHPSEITRKKLSEAARKRWSENAEHYFACVMAKRQLFLDDGVFHSQQELDAAKILKEFGLVNHFVNGVNCQIKVGDGFVDLRLDSGTFIEIHTICPLFKGRYESETLEQYAARRRKLLDDHGYQDFELLVFETARQLRAYLETAKANLN